MVRRTSVDMKHNILSDLELPEGLELGVTSTPEGRNIFQENGTNYRPILQLETQYVDEVDLDFEQSKTNF